MGKSRTFYGNLYAAEVNDYGVPIGSWWFLGEAYPLTIRNTREVIKIPGRTLETNGKTIDTKDRQAEATGALTLFDFNAQNVAMHARGTVQTRAVTESTLDYLPVALAEFDRYVEIGTEDLAGVAVRSATGSSGSLSAADVALGAIGEEIEIGHQNLTNVVVTHTSGTPTYDLGDDYTIDPVKGTITPVADGDISAEETVKITADYVDMELCIEDTDYRLDPVLGLIAPLAGGRIAASSTVYVSATGQANTDQRVVIGAGDTLKVAIKGSLKDDFTQSVVKVYLRRVTMTAQNDLPLLSAEDTEREQLDFELVPEVPIGHSDYGTIDGLPI